MSLFLMRGTMHRPRNADAPRPVDRCAMFLSAILGSLSVRSKLADSDRSDTRSRVCEWCLVILCIRCAQAVVDGRDTTALLSLSPRRHILSLSPRPFSFPACFRFRRPFPFRASLVSAMVVAKQFWTLWKKNWIVLRKHWVLVRLFSVLPDSGVEPAAEPVAMFHYADRVCCLPQCVVWCRVLSCAVAC